MQSMVLFIIGTVLWGMAGSARAGQTERVSVDSGGNEANGYSFSPSMSRNGRFVAFYSNADNLVADDTNGQDHIFVRDRRTGSTTRVSIDSAGNEANEFNYDPALSGDGQFVAFTSGASNLVANDGNEVTDIFVHARKTGQTERVSVSSNGAEANGGSDEATVSEDGRFVAFTSGSDNLVAGDTNGVADIFVHDRKTRQTERVSVDSTGGETNGDSYVPAISADGRFIAFVSLGDNLVANDTNGREDIFVHERKTKQTTRVSVDSAGNEANAESFGPTISQDGRLIAFRSAASNLVANDHNETLDIFVYNRQTGRTKRVSINSAGNEANGLSSDPAPVSKRPVCSFHITCQQSRT